MCHTDINQFNYLETMLNEYPIGGYVIAHEAEPYSHFHFLVEMEEDDYTRFRKRVFIDKLKLRGQARNGEPRQYGKVANIEDFDKMLSYTVKDSNIRSNLSDETLSDAIDKSFKKQSPKLLKDKMVKYIDEVSDNRFITKLKIYTKIVEFCRSNSIPMTKSQINSYYFYYRQFSKNPKSNLKDEDFLRQIMGEFEFNEKFL